jgi:pimeloyl-ACP methyl ester carboxylesterase
MVGDYSGLYWIDRDLHRSIDPPDIQRLNQIAAPTLVILGERDVSDFHAIAGILQESISGAQKAILPGVGHMSSMEAPQRFNEVVLDFLVSL